MNPARQTLKSRYSSQRERVPCAVGWALGAAVQNWAGWQPYPVWNFLTSTACMYLASGEAKRETLERQANVLYLGWTILPFDGSKRKTSNLSSNGNPASIAADFNAILYLPDGRHGREQVGTWSDVRMSKHPTDRAPLR